MAEKSEKKSRRSRKKSKSTDDDGDFDTDYVDRQLKMAEKQVARAMGQMRLAGKTAKAAEKLGAKADKMWGDNDPQGANDKGVTINHHGTMIQIHSAENVQVGSGNTMFVMNGGGKSKKSSRRHKSYDSDEEEIQERAQQNHARQDAEPTDRLTEEILKSERLVTPQDLELAGRHIGADWRRFLRFLELDDSLLSQLYQEFYVNGIREVVVQGLTVWKRQADKQATLGVLTSTLKKVGYASVVKEFKL